MSELLPGCSVIQVSWLGWSDQANAESLADELSIAYLGLGTRARNCLTYNDTWWGRVNTIGKLVAHTADELLERRNLAEVTLGQIRSRLAARGLALKGE